LVTTGRSRLLLALYACDLIAYALLVLSTSFRPSAIFLLVWAPLILTLIATELVYRDARRINQEKGSKLLNATLWSLLTLLFWFVTLPVYVFVRRKDALLTESRPPQDANNYESTVRPPKVSFKPSHAVLFFGLIGSLVLAFGVGEFFGLDQVFGKLGQPPSNLYAANGTIIGTISYSSDAIAKYNSEAGALVIIVGLAFIGIATGVYVVGRRAHSRATS